MRDDMREALRNARTEIDRYNAANAGFRYLMYEFLLGDRERAWSDFGEFANRFGDESAWTAAFLGHRMQGLEGGNAVKAWLADARSHDTRRDYLSGALRERHAFMLLFLDRPPSNAAVEVIRQVTAENNRSPFYVDLAEGYLAFRTGDYATAVAKWNGIHQDLFNISMNRHSSLDDVLPYLALSYARSGRTEEGEKVLQDHRINLGEDFDYLVGRALLDGIAGKHKEAAASLRLAFARYPGPQTRSFFPGYALLEACKILLRDSGNDSYRRLIEDFAGRLQLVVPYSWAAAFEAKYARDAATRRVALAAAVILDPKSERISQFSESERAAARGAAAQDPGLLGAALRQLAGQTRSPAP